VTYGFVISVVLSASGGIKVQNQNMSTGMYFPFYITFFCVLQLIDFLFKDIASKPKLVLIAIVEGNYCSAFLFLLM
jgi:hypothetical protein